MARRGTAWDGTIGDGLYGSRQREARDRILVLIANSDSVHCSIQSIRSILTADGFGPPTLYRALRRLESDGQIRRVSLNGVMFVESLL